MAKDNKTLHLILKRKWWDMIASGEKREEYRDVCHFWAVRLLDIQFCEFLDTVSFPNELIAWLCVAISNGNISYRNYDSVCFHLGYTKTSMTFRIESIKVKIGEECNQDWGAERNKYYFVIRLGERVI